MALRRFAPTYQFIKGLLRNFKDLQIDCDHMMAISPDEGATERAIYLANMLNLDMGMFYKRRDYTKIVNGRNPIVAMNSWALLWREGCRLSWMT